MSVEDHDYCASGCPCREAAQAMVIVHSDGEKISMHAPGAPCALCRPPIEVTEAMVDAAMWQAPALDPIDRINMRAALEAALNG